MLCFFFNDTATTEIYTLSLHDALPIFSKARGLLGRTLGLVGTGQIGREVATRARAFGMRVVAWSRSLTDETDRKSTRLNSSHANISYAVFCLKKKKSRVISPVDC